MAEGSIIVTLKAEYLATLSAGEHTVVIRSATGDAAAKFTILPKAESPDDAKTGDTGNVYLWIFLLMIPCAALTLFGAKGRKKDSDKETDGIL